jgi:hypothetical protein
MTARSNFRRTIRAAEWSSKQAKQAREQDK